MWLHFLPGNSLEGLSCCVVAAAHNCCFCALLQVPVCGATRLSVDELRALLQGQSITFIGDSHTRFWYYWLDVVL